jgi:hypothetical protein
MRNGAPAPTVRGQVGCGGPGSGSAFGVRGYRRCSRLVTRCTRSTRCRWPATANGIPPRGAKSDPGDAHVLAEIVRLDHAHHRPIAGDSPQAEATKMVARAHQSLVWDRSRHVLRLRSTLREFFPAALAAFDDLTAPDTL